MRLKRCIHPFALLLFPLFSIGQEIKSISVDPFTQEKTIETSIVSLKQGVTTGFGVSYFAINNSYYFNIIGYGSADNSIGKEDKVWLVLEDGKVIQFNSRIEMEESEQYKNIYAYHYFVKLEDVETLKNKKVAIVRVVSGEKRVDIKVSSRSAKELSKLSDLFLTEVSK